MPMPGGPSDKAGNSYERRWTVFAMLDLLHGRGTSLRIEVPGQAGVGAEFRLTVGGVPEWHQAKRQRSRGPWTISNMASGGILQPWWDKIQRGDRCAFVTSSGCEELAELVERAASAASWEEFNREFLAAQDQRSRFQHLSNAWGSPGGEAAYRALSQVKVYLIGELELAQWIEDRLAVIVDGDPSTASAVLAQLADDSCHRELTTETVWSRLAKHSLNPAMRRTDTREPAYRSILRDLIGRTPALVGRDSELDAVKAFAGGDPGYRWFVGSPWAGKTALSAHVLQTLEPDTDCVAYFLQQRRSDADSERFVAAVVPQLAWLLNEPLPTKMGFDEFLATWERACKRAAEVQRPLLLIVDGLDEDLRPRGLSSVASLLPAHLGSHGHVLVTSRPNPTLPEDVEADHPIRGVQPTVLSQSDEARHIQERALHELSLLLRGPGLSSKYRRRARDVLGTMAVARGALTPIDVSHIIDMPVRDVREIVTHHAARVLEPLGDGMRFQFAHQALLDTCLRILDADEETETRLRRVTRWATSWRERGWPSDSTPSYLVADYPFALVAVHSYAAAGEVVSDLAWTAACIAIGGVALAQSALASAAPAGDVVDGMRRIVDCEAHHLSRNHPVARWDYVVRQLALAVLRVGASSAVGARLNECLERLDKPWLTAVWTTRPLEPALVRVLGRASNEVRAVGVTPDDRIAFTITDGLISAWEVQGSGESWIIGRHSNLWSLVISPDGRYLAAASDSVVNYELGSTMPPVEIDGHVDALAISHNGRRLYGSAPEYDHGIWGWDLDREASPQTATPPRIWEPQWQDEDATPALALALTRDDNYLVAVNHAGQVVTWRLAGARQPRIVRHRFDGVTAAALTPDAHLAVVVDAHGFVHVCHPMQRRRSIEVAKLDAGVLAIAVDPTGRYAVVVALDGTVRALDLTHNDSLRVLGRHDQHLELARRPSSLIPEATGEPEAHETTDGEWYPAGVAVAGGVAVTAGRDRFLRVWSLAALDRPSLDNLLADSPTCLCLASDGRTAVTGSADGSITLWEMSTTGINRTIKTRGNIAPVFIAISPDDQNVVVVGADCEIQIMEISSPSLLQTVGWCEDPGDTFALAAHGNRLVGFADVGRINVWDLAGRFPAYTPGSVLATVRAIATVPHQNVAVAVLLNRSVYVLDMNDEPRMRIVGRLAGPPIRCVALTDDACGAITGRDDGTIQLWDLKGHKDPTTRGEPGAEPIRSIRVGSDSKFAASLSNQGTVRIWDLTSTATPYRLDHGARRVTHLTFSPNGDYLITGEPEGLRLWNLESRREIARVSFRGLQRIAIGKTFNSAGQCSVLTYSSELGLTSWRLAM